jgi:hypothetical protein
MVLHKKMIILCKDFWAFFGLDRWVTLGFEGRRSIRTAIGMACRNAFLAILLHSNFLAILSASGIYKGK